jgi:uroporphyrin-III C-methyltransferase / precorrin-2 dehydrogenase / sirohydrochlorin ferrochelatase
LDYFPAFLDLRGRACLLVGAGEIAQRKARLLLAAGAELTVVAPRACPLIESLAEQGRVRYHRRGFAPADVAGQWLVVCATGAAAVRSAVRAAADRARVFCNSVDDVAASSYITPAIVDRGAVVVAVSSGGSAPVLARRIRARIEALLPSGIGELAALAGRWRRRVAERIPDSDGRRRFWERLFDGRSADELQAGPAHEAERRLEALLERGVEPGDERGMAWLVGAGPGDPGLLTLDGLAALQAADVILHDRLVPEEILALARRDAERIAVGKAPGATNNTQEHINALLTRLVGEGKRVCRLKGGDPLIFGRGGEEIEALAAAGLPCRVIPGVTAAAGCAAYAGIPLTHRDAAQSVVLLTAHGKDSVDRLDWASLARERQTLAVYMGVRRFPDLMQQLIAHGRGADTPVALVENGTTPRQRVIRGSLGQLVLLAEAHKIESPAILIIGEVARIEAARPAAEPPEHGPDAGVYAMDRSATNQR